MTNLKLPTLFFVAAICLLNSSCNSPTNNAKKNNTAQTSANDSMNVANSSIAIQNDNQQGKDTTSNNGDASAQNNSTDSILSQLNGLTSMLAKNDSGILKNIGGGGNMDSMMQKMQSMLGGKGGSPGDAIGKLLLNCNFPIYGIYFS